MARRSRRTAPLLRFVLRVAMTLGGCFVISVLSIAFAHRLHENFALARELASTEHAIRALRVQRAEETREVRRLQTSEGVVPYIYRRLRMVKPGQTLIYLVPAPSPSANP
ncbi:MAG TPA: hypothetical protein VIN40_10090 [Candidatus Tyrphobacter sp.]